MTIKYISLISGFAFINGALRPVEIVSQILTKKVGDNGEELPNGIELTVKSSGSPEVFTISASDFYIDKECYVKGNPIGLDTLYAFTLGLSDNWTYFVLENGRPVEKNFDLNSITVCMSDKGSWTFRADTLPDEYYRTSVLCAGMSEFKYIDENGEEKTHKGAAVIDAWKKAEEIGVTFAYELESGGLLAFNNEGTRNVVGYNESESDYDEVPGEAADILNIGIGPYYFGSDDQIFVKKD